MKRIILFSDLNVRNKEVILGGIFPAEIEHKVLSYMPSGGIENAEPYIGQWKDIARHYGAEFNLIDNSISSEKEKIKIRSSNILVLSGGNTFNLLKRLRESGLDKSISEFLKKEEFVISGYSAGALVLTPNINICNLPGFDDNNVKLQDFTGLNIVDFEIFPHYNNESQETTLEDYRKSTTNRIATISEDDYIRIDF